MDLHTLNPGQSILITGLIFLIISSPVAGFGAGNIPSISSIEGLNFRHGDIEDMLKTVACLKGHKWTSLMIKRVYFGNWLRDYSQAVDVGSLKGVSAPTIRLLVWVLSFLSFGYATKEFEVTDERLGVYRPEEHIDNPKDYADNKDARQYDERLRGPIQEAELEIDPNTGMKNYIANDRGGWATSSGYVRFSFLRSIHFGRIYTSGTEESKGREEDLCEALRCLGQGLHCLEDFGAHTNYVELALRELGYYGVFPHTGYATEIDIRGNNVFPLVTGTFGAVDFLHSVLGEATDHFSQTEVDEMDIVLKNAETSRCSGTRRSSLFGSGGDLISLLGKIPGKGNTLSSTARNLQSASQAQRENGAKLSDLDASETIRKIYPILEFRDNVVKAINKTIAKIPGLESLVDKVSETLTLFILSLLSPFIRPIIDTASKTLKQGSTTVLEASAKAQFEPWNDPICTDPTHSMLSKDHFSNILNCVAGRLATTILQYVTPRIIYAWENPAIDVNEVIEDILHVFHHPALRDESLEIHCNMFETIRKWVEEQPNPHDLNEILGSESVKAGRNHKLGDGARDGGHNHGALGGHGKTSGSIWTEIQSRDLDAMKGNDQLSPVSGTISGTASFNASPYSPNFGYNQANPNNPNNFLNHSNPQYSEFPSGPSTGDVYGNWQQGPTQYQGTKQGHSTPFPAQFQQTTPGNFSSGYPGSYGSYPNNNGYYG